MTGSPESSRSEDPLAVEGSVIQDFPTAAASAEGASTHIAPIRETLPESEVLGTNTPLIEAEGIVIGQYRLIEKIGQGGMGSVWKALHLKLEKHVAIKLLPKEWHFNSVLMSRFEREMKAVGKLEHPHIVRAMDAGEAHQRHYLVMELVEGYDLSEWIKKRGPQKVTDACEMIRHAAQGLAHAHENGLIHRDIKPNNLFLTKQGKVKVLDLGLALTQSDIDASAATTITGQGAFLGTPDYMAPEQWENTHDVDARCDLYALGCTFFYLLTGRAPFAETKYASLTSKMKGHMLDPIPDLVAEREIAMAGRPKLQGDVIPPEVNAIYLKLMAKQREDRFSSASELVKALEPHSKSRVANALRAAKDESQDSIASAPSTAASKVTPTNSAPTNSAPTNSAPTNSAPTNSAPTNSAPSKAVPSVSTSTPARSFSSKQMGLLGGAVALVLLLGVIIIKITNKDGTVTEIKVPEGAKVEVTETNATPQPQPSPQPPEFVPLFNGRDLTGWTTANGGAGNWRVVDGALTCVGNTDYLYSQRDDIGDFHLKAECRINATGNSGLYFRASKPLVVIGDYEAQLTFRPEQQKLGSLYGIAQASSVTASPDAWLTLEIIAEGNHLRVLVDGKQTVDFTETRPNRRMHGHLVLQHHDTQTAVQFRKIEIKETSPKVVTSAPATVVSSKPLPPLPPINLDEVDPLPKWELPAGAPQPVVAPCDPQQATALQKQWADYLKRPVIEETARKELGLKFALIPPGEFRKVFTRSGDAAIEPDMPTRRFRVTQPYAMSTTEVTWDQFRQFVEATGYKTDAETSGLGGQSSDGKRRDPKINWRNPSWSPAPNEPVTQVTHRDAAAFCAWLTSLSSDSKAVYRLPNEAEWLHACRAGSDLKHVFGPAPQDVADYAWTIELLEASSGGSVVRPVGLKKPNAFGLHDVLGNVWEFVLGALRLEHELTPNHRGSNALGSRLLKGSGWAAIRDKTLPEWTWFDGPAFLPSIYSGFRVVREQGETTTSSPLERPLLVRRGSPLWSKALVSRPQSIPGLRSWSLELAGMHSSYRNDVIAVNPVREEIAISNGFGRISLWNREGQFQRILAGCDASIDSLQFSKDGRWLVSSDHSFVGQSTARIWNVASSTLVAVIPVPAYRTGGAKFSPDGKQLAISFMSAPGWMVVDLATGLTRSPVTDEFAVGLAWSPSGTELACLNSKHLRVWDTQTLRPLREVEVPYSSPLEWSPDGRWLAMRGAADELTIRDARTLELRHSVPALKIAKDDSHTLAWLPDSQRLLVTPTGVEPTCVVDALTGKVAVQFDQKHRPYQDRDTAVASFASGREAVVAYDGRLYFFDTTTGKKLRQGPDRARNDQGDLRAELSADGREVFQMGRPGFVVVSDAQTGDELRQMQMPPIAGLRSLYWLYPAPDGKSLAVKLNHPVPAMALVDPKTGSLQHELSHGDSNVMDAVWSADGRKLATAADDKCVRLWNTATGRLEHRLAEHPGPIWSMAWAPDGTRLATMSDDKQVRVWDPTAGKLVATHKLREPVSVFRGGPTMRLDWTTDSRRLWVALSGQIALLDAETGELGPDEKFGHDVYFLNASPDGQRLLVRETTGSTFVRGRDAQDRRLLDQCLGRTAQWHPDNSRFLGHEGHYGLVGFDVNANRRLGIRLPWLSSGHWLCIGPTGHYRGNAGVEEHIVYVALHEDGSQRTYSPAEFAQKFGWKNDSSQAFLLGK